ncbi:MAG: cob(I)yrinic acid a,c-diamide adenosyltransferase [Chthoniobacterales bacterium]|nr:MAG: cob(I)yrinic acid a,c-diamide adenosyltransferase [Chthoniobacterales bacterium]
MSIATKTGDAGETSLMYGRRVSKSDARVDAYGCVDELNAALGLARVTANNPFLTEQIYAVQKELIIVMGELATAQEDLDRYAKDGFRLTDVAMTDRLTAVVDDLEKNKLGKFKGWAVPGKTLDSATLDLARTVCRRAERRVATSMAETEKFNAEILRYLNRLSDLCWLLARYAEHLHDESESAGAKR